MWEKIKAEARLFKAWLKSPAGLGILEALEAAEVQVELVLQRAALGSPWAEVFLTVLEGVIASPASHPAIGDVPVSTPQQADDLATWSFGQKPEWSSLAKVEAPDPAPTPAPAPTPTPAPPVAPPDPAPTT